MISPDEALELVIRTAAPLPPAEIGLDDALGLVLAEEISADQDYPPFPRSMMDGFAVRLADAGKTVPIVGEAPAGSVWSGELTDGTCIEILTGAPCPPGAEAVVPKENVQRHDMLVHLPATIRPGQSIAPQGSDCRQGQRVLGPGQIVAGMAIGTLAAFGRTSVRATPLPLVAIIATGEELAHAGQPLRPGQVRNSNGPMVSALVREQGLAPPRQLTVADRLDTTADALEACAEADIIVLSGGVSVGTYDFVPRALEQFGAETVFHGVNQKPGKPILFARRGRQLIFGLPGNPLSCHFGLHRYVAAAIRRLSGRKGHPQVFRGALADRIEIKGGRVNFLPGHAVPTESTGGWRVELLAGASSADIFQSCTANCYVELPAVTRTYENGTEVQFTWMGCASRSDE
jgi:molybdopterin molybdotransferase